MIQICVSTCRRGRSAALCADVCKWKKKRWLSVDPLNANQNGSNNWAAGTGFDATIQPSVGWIDRLDISVFIHSNPRCKHNLNVAFLTPTPLRRGSHDYHLSRNRNNHLSPLSTYRGEYLIHYAQTRLQFVTGSRVSFFLLLSQSPLIVGQKAHLRAIVKYVVFTLLSTWNENIVCTQTHMYESSVEWGATGARQVTNA